MAAGDRFYNADQTNIQLASCQEPKVQYDLWLVNIKIIRKNSCIYPLFISIMHNCQNYANDQPAFFSTQHLYFLIKYCTVANIGSALSSNLLQSKQSVHLLFTYMYSSSKYVLFCAFSSHHFAKMPWGTDHKEKVSLQCGFLCIFS